MRVVIVEDAVTVRRSLVEMLADVPAVQVCGEAEDVDAAEDLVEQLKPDAVIVDIQLRKGNGIDLVRRIKRHGNGHAPKVIVLTNYPYPQYRTACTELGAEYFFDKSTEFEKVVGVFRDMVAERENRGLNSIRRLPGKHGAPADLGAGFLNERLSNLGRVTSGLVHDLNNALMPIMGFSSMVVDHPQGLKSLGEAVSLIKEIYEASVDAKDIVSRVAQFSKAGPADVRESLSVGELLRSTVRMTEPLWKTELASKGILIRTLVEADAGLRVSGNGAHLRQALMNLVLNAIDAMPAGGTIRLAATGTGQDVVITVSDQGLGMTTAVKAKCMDPFFTTRGANGTGLGLAMVKATMDTHGGSISISTKEGAGTTVTLRLPCIESSAGTAKEGTARSPAKALRILIVDDDDRCRQAVQLSLRTAGHLVESVDTGRGALEHISRGIYEVVIVDRNLGDMSGEDVVSSIKTSHPALAVIMLTGFDSVGYPGSPGKGAPDLVLRKPVSGNELAAAVVKASEHSSSAKP